jgi:hypothetical protein
MSPPWNHPWSVGLPLFASLNGVWEGRRRCGPAVSRFGAANTLARTAMVSAPSVRLTELLTFAGSSAHLWFDVGRTVVRHPMAQPARGGAIARSAWDSPRMDNLIGTRDSTPRPSPSFVLRWAP